jgi:integrase
LKRFAALLSSLLLDLSADMNPAGANQLFSIALIHVFSYFQLFPRIRINLSFVGIFWLYLSQAFARICGRASRVCSPAVAQNSPERIRMADRKLLTDRYLRALLPAPHGQRVEVFDARVPGFGIRISDTVDADSARRGKAGKISFMLYARFSSGAPPTRRVIGTYGAITLEEARRTAGEWRSLIDKGIDPVVVEAEAREKADRERALRIKHSFANVAEAFIADKLSQERSGKMIERDFRSTFIAAWGDRPISEIGALDVLEIVNRKKRHAPQMARTLMIMVRRFFNWAVDAQVYGLTASPCDRLKTSKIIGPLPSRTRRLTDDELFAFWRATGRMKYPVGPVYRVLALTGLRLNEAAKLSWPEVQGELITIPASRMKGRDATAREHLVPVTSAVQEVIGPLPRYRGGKYLFSFNAGQTPLAMNGPIKRDLDRRMLWTLKAMARGRGEDHHAVTLPNWTNHDLRRVVRSGLSQLRVPHNVAEAVLAHKPPGIVGVYDTHEYLDEKREALEAWAQRIASIVKPVPAAPAKVVKLARRRR